MFIILCGTLELEKTEICNKKGLFLEILLGLFSLLLVFG
jgi:hypothetical protein